MSTAKARMCADCSLCDRRVKPGQRIALHFETEAWVHLSCMMQMLAFRDMEQRKAA